MQEQTPDRRRTGALSAEDAKQLTDRAREQASALWRTVLALYNGRAHEALDYPSWAAYWRAEFSQGSAHAYRLLRAARVEAVVSVHVDTEGMTEAQARILAPLPEELQVEIARRVEEAGGFSSLSAPEVRRLRDIVQGTVIVVDDETAWDEGEVAAASRSIRRLTYATRAAWGSPDALRRMPAAEAGKVRQRVSLARAQVFEARREAERALDALDRAADALDQRDDLPRAPWGESWEAHDRGLPGSPDRRQMTIRDVEEQIAEDADPA